MLPASPSLSHIWTGSLLKKEYSPDTRVTREMMSKLIEHQQRGELCIAAYETSCDDIGAAVYKNGKEIWRMTTTYVQQNQEKGKGGVNPLETALAHREAITVVQKEMDEFLCKNKLTPHYVAVTRGPGLALTLVEGIYHAQKIAHDLGIPVFLTDHIMAHAITPMKDNPGFQYPFVCQIVSGGHTLTMLVRSATDMVRICCSGGDAWGEVIDKTARTLGRDEIPAGPAMEIIMNLFLEEYKDSYNEKIWSDVLPTTTDKALEKMVSLCPIDEQPVVLNQLKEYRRILKEVYGEESVSASLCPSQVKAVLNKLIEQEKLKSYNKDALLVEFIREFCPYVKKNDVVKMVNSVEWKIRADSIMRALTEPRDTLLYQHQINRYTKVLEKKENATPNFNDFFKLSMTETSLPEQTQSCYSAVLHTVIANSLIADAMTAHAQYPDVTRYSFTGGVGCNRYIAYVITKALEKVGITFQSVEPRNCSDNGAMVAELAHRSITEKMSALPNIDELIDDLFKIGLGMSNGLPEPTLTSVAHSASDRWSGPTCA